MSLDSTDRGLGSVDEPLFTTDRLDENETPRKPG